MEYVLGYVTPTAGEAKKPHLRFMEEGIAQGHREDLTGGGLIRSVGGWAEVTGVWNKKGPPWPCVERGEAIARENGFRRIE